MADPSTRSAIKHGFALEQVERSSKALLPWMSRAHLTAAETAAGPDYRVHTCTGPRADPVARGHRAHAHRTSMDAPAAGLDVDEDPWTPERIMEDEERERDSPRTYLDAAAEHVPSGASWQDFSVLSAPAERERAVSQEDTLVLREHRGHKLGMLAEGGEPRVPADRAAGSSSGHDLQRRRERAHARGERRARVRAGRVVGGVEACPGRQLAADPLAPRAEVRPAVHELLAHDRAPAARARLPCRPYAFSECEK